MADPGERSLDDPAFGKHGEAMLFIALDDRQLPGAGLGDGGIVSQPSTLEVARLRPRA